MITKSTISVNTLLIISILYINIFKSYGQQQYKIAIVAFYNCENFYDTLNNENTRDEEFLPAGERHYNTAVYRQKLNQLARVIAEMGTDKSADGPALLGLAEIENKAVLQDLVAHPLLRHRNYRIIHYDCKDARGVDVAFLYNPVYFTVDSSCSFPVIVKGHAANTDRKQIEFTPEQEENSFYYHSRDILWIKGKLDGETVHIYVNHWPSRLGGETRTAAARKTAALVCKRHWDSVATYTPGTRSIIMGDFNDDPINASIVKTLKAKPAPDTTNTHALFNPWVRLFKQGNGTLAYRDAWGLFDQIIINQGWLPQQQAGFYFYAAHIYKPEYMTENHGKYKGYPMRFWEGTQVRGGYSDHYPVYIVLLKQAGNTFP